MGYPQSPAIGSQLRTFRNWECRPYCFWLWSERSDFLCTRYDPFSFHLHYLHFITGALLDTAYIGYLFCPSRRTTNNDDSSFPATVLFGKVFLELRLALVKIFGSILFKSIQSFSPFILHFMYCVQMIFYWEFCLFRSWWILEEELLRPLLGQFDTINRTLLGYYALSCHHS